jgi:hypothetical protein
MSVSVNVSTRETWPTHGESFLAELLFDSPYESTQPLPSRVAGRNARKRKDPLQQNRHTALLSAEPYMSFPRGGIGVQTQRVGKLGIGVHTDTKRWKIEVPYLAAKSTNVFQNPIRPTLGREATVSPALGLRALPAVQSGTVNTQRAAAAHVLHTSTP